MLLTGADIIIRVLIEQDCRTVFGYPGGQILSVYDSLYKYKDEITHILTAHEQGAAHAADGYARVTGRPGVVIATSGPGATNLVTGIATAHLDSVPLIAITGNVATYQIGYDSFQELDITGVTLPITKHNYFVDSIEELADTLREAFRVAVSGRPGPVLIDVPKDVQTALWEYEPQTAVTADEPFAAKDVRIEAAAQCINSAMRPYIYFGGGVIRGEAQEEMLALAELIDAPLGCSLMGLSAIPTDHPRFLGMQGMHGHYAASKVMQNADVIIALGVRFNDRVTGDRHRFAKDARIVHIDIDGSELSKALYDTHGLRADLKCTLARLIPQIKKKRHPKWQELIAEIKKEAEKFDDDRPGMTPKNIISTLQSHVGANTAVVTDVGQHQMWTAQYLRQQTVRRFVTSGGLGTMGFGFGAAMGAYVGTGERSVLITGDGSFGMSINELATAVTYGFPVTVLIMNNGVLGMVHQWQTLFFEGRYSCTELDRKTDFVAVARGFGADGETVSTLSELEAALARADMARGPYIIDCKVSKDELVFPMRPPEGTADDIIVK